MEDRKIDEFWDGLSKKDERNLRMRDNGIIMFKANKKNDRSPDFRGELDIKGQKYRFALWIARDRDTNEIRKDKNGNSFCTGIVEADTGKSQELPL